MKRIIELVVLLSFSVGVFSECEDDVKPLNDGYVLNGTVRDSISDAPIDSVEVLFAWDRPDTLAFGSICLWTDDNGRFTFQGFPGTAPSKEVFRFQKTGYRTKDVYASRCSVRQAAFEYRLTVELVQERDKAD